MKNEVVKSGSNIIQFSGDNTEQKGGQYPILAPNLGLNPK